MARRRREIEREKNEEQRHAWGVAPALGGVGSSVRMAVGGGVAGSVQHCLFITSSVQFSFLSIFIKITEPNQITDF